MTPETLSALHARGFAGQGRAWTTQEFADLLTSPHVFVVGDDRAFAMGRVVVDEAELLTIATDPSCRCQGLGRMVLTRFESIAAKRGATRVILEVAADNIAALSLYRSSGYSEISRRPAYYENSGGVRVDAIIMEKTS